MAESPGTKLQENGYYVKKEIEHILRLPHRNDAKSTVFKIPLAHFPQYLIPGKCWEP